MENRVKISLCVLLFTLIIAETTSPAPSITIVGADWSLTIDSSDLQSGAGSDLVSSYENIDGDLSIDILGFTEQCMNARVDVSKSDTNWHANFQLLVKRTSNGDNPQGWVSGGTTYQEITDTDQEFFTLSGNRSNITIQLRLNNVSVQIPPDTYTTTINYTVVCI